MDYISKLEIDIDLAITIYLRRHSPKSSKIINEGQHKYIMSLAVAIMILLNRGKWSGAQDS
jgi:hypothetical protein